MRRALIAILILGAFLRIIFLGRESLLFDELYIVMIDKLPLGDMLREALAASHLPLYHLAVHIWLLAGSDEAWIRLLSAVAGMGTIVLTYLVAKEIFYERTGLWSAALVAVSPFLIWYSRAVTFYSFMIALTMLSFYMLTRCATRGGWKNWTGYVLSSFAMVLTYFYAAILIGAAFFAYLLLRRKEKSNLVSFLISQTLLLATLPFAFRLSRLAITEPTQRLSFGPGEIMTTWKGIAVSPFAIIGGWLDPVVNYTGREAPPLFHFLIAFLAVSAGAAALVISKRFRGLFDRKLIAVLFYTFLLVAGPLALQAANQGRMSGRLYVWAVPFFMISMAALLTRVPGPLKTFIAAATVAALLSLSLWQLTEPPMRDADWHGVMNGIAREWQEGDRLACFPLHNCTLAADYYLPQQTAIVGGMPVGNGRGAFFMAPGARWTGYNSGYWAEYGITPPLSGQDLEARLASDLAGAPRVWLIAQKGLLDQQPDIRRTLEGSWDLVEKKDLGHFELMLFGPRDGGTA